MCDNISIKRSKIYWLGYETSKRCFLCAMGIHLLVTKDHQQMNSPSWGQLNDTVALTQVDFRFRTLRQIFGGKECTNYLVKDLLNEAKIQMALDYKRI